MNELCIRAQKFLYTFPEGRFVIISKVISNVIVNFTLTALRYKARLMVG